MARLSIATGLSPAGRRALDSRELHIWCFQIGDNGKTLQLAHRLLSHDERERALRFRVDAAMRSYVVSRAMTRTILGDFCDKAPEDIQFDYTAEGKPFVSGGVHFNVSHSGDLVACAVTACAPIGVDIEIHKPISDWELVARNFFCENEFRNLNHAVPRCQRVAAFHDCWVRKEAVVKALGGGLSIPLDSFEVSVLPDAPYGLLAVNDLPDEAREWTLETFRPGSGYSGAVALRSRSVRLCVYETRPASELLSGGVFGAHWVGQICPTS